MKNSIKNRIYNTQWLIEANKLTEIVNFVEKQSDFQQIKTLIENNGLGETEKELNPTRTGKYYTINDNLAVMYLHGSIVRYANLFTEWCGGTSLELFMKEFETLANNHEIEKIIIDVDSPGGEANGISEAAQYIHETGKQKPIIAYASNMACSAAYWLASACTNFYISNTAMVGSIGVVIEFIDTTNKDEKDGIKKQEITSDQSPDKRIDLTTEEGIKKLKQDMLNPLAQVFIEAVASYRKTSTENVLKNYGRGSVLIGQEAIKQGMADGLNTFNKLLKGKPMNEQEQKELINKALNQENERMNAISAICTDEKLIQEARNNREWTEKDVAFEMIKRGIPTKAQQDEANKKATMQKLVEDDRSALSLGGKLTTEDTENQPKTILELARSRAKI